MTYEPTGQLLGFVAASTYISSFRPVIASFIHALFHHLQRIEASYTHLITCEIVDCYCIYETITLLTRHCHGFDRPREKGLASPGFRNGYVLSVQDHINQRNR